MIEFQIKLTAELEDILAEMVAAAEAAGVSPTVLEDVVAIRAELAARYARRDRIYQKQTDAVIRREAYRHKYASMIKDGWK